MARQHGIPGEWARVRGVVLSLWPLFLSFLLLGFFLGALFSGGYTIFFAVLSFCACLGLMLAWRKGTHRVESFFVGARGEERVATALGTLSDDYHILNDFIVGRYHVDHVVLGPTGVYVIETKNWHDSVTIEEGCILANGRLPSRNPLDQALHEKMAVKEFLHQKGIDTDVMGILCFASDSLKTSNNILNGITLVNVSEVNAWILSRPLIIHPVDVIRMVELMQ